MTFLVTLELASYCKYKNLLEGFDFFGLDGALVMARRKRTEIDHDLLYERWTMFGEWITVQRLLVGFTQKRAAEAVGVSRRQWIRYELGAKVPEKRMELMARVLNVNPDKMLDRAGYQTSFKRHAARQQLGRILDNISAGQLGLAMLQLLRLNDRITGVKAADGPRSGGLVATDYSHAVVLLNRLPLSWAESLQGLLQERINDKADKREKPLKGRNLIRKKRDNSLHWAVVR